MNADPTHIRQFWDWNQKDHKFKVTFSYTEISKPVWVTWEISSGGKTTKIQNE